MCRNITELRGLEPAATDDEITAAARQYVRKVSGITRPTDAVAGAFEAAVAEVAATTAPTIPTSAPATETASIAGGGLPPTAASPSTTIVTVPGATPMNVPSRNDQNRTPESPEA